MKTNQAVHACAVQVHSLGILILGASGSGKSELILELINKGYTFIADDLVLLEKSNNQIFITNPNHQYQLHIRDIGLVDVSIITKQIINTAPLNIVIQLTETKGTQFDQLRLEHQAYAIDNIDFPIYTIHDSCRRNLALLVETIVHQETSKTQYSINEQILQLQGNIACKLS